MAWNSGSLSIAQLLAIKSMMENVKKQEEEQKKVEALYDPASLTGNHRG